MKKEPVNAISEDEKNPQKPDYIGHRQRLKSRFLADRGRSMPDYELLELVLTYALPRRDVKPLAKELLKRFDSLDKICTSAPEELAEVKGVGENVVILLNLIHTCVYKICGEKLHEKDSPYMLDRGYIVEYCRAAIGYSRYENLMIIYIDQHGKLIKDSIEQVGSLDTVAVSPREVVTKALLYHASSIIVSHNHPSGDCTPSDSDMRMTRALKQSLQVMGIILYDHIIVGPKNSYSMKSRHCL